MLIALASFAAPHADGQPLVPLGQNSGEPLLPSGISRDTVELSGQYAYLWSQPDGTQVIQYQGNFELLNGARRMTAQGAVIWMSRATWQGRPYFHYEVFLWREAKLIESAGTTTTGPALFVTFNSYEPPEVRADATTGASSAQTELYAEANKVREVVAKATPVSTQPSELRVIPVGQEAQAVQPKVRPLVTYRGEKQTISEKEGIATAIGNVYLSQGALNSAEFLEIRADAAVIFLAKPEAQPPAEERATTGKAARPPAPAEGEASPAPPAGPLATPGPLGDQFGRAVSGAYLEGNVLLTRGEQMIRAPQLYYDFENDRALILDAVMRTTVPDRSLPIYVRAKEIRQLSSTEYVADKAKISTSEFYTPAVYVEAGKVVLVDRTPRMENLRSTGPLAGEYTAYNTTLNVEGVPVFYWPYSQGNFQQTENLLRAARFGYDSTFGAAFQTKWYLFNLLGLQTPEGWDSALRLDYFTKRGPGVGVDFDYNTENYYGMFRGYYINDHGKDELGPYNSGYPPNDNRGRITWRHRQYLPQDWELTLEVGYLSDPNFLHQYFEHEFYTDKPEETLIYLKKQRDNWAFTLLNQYRIDNFLTQTESLPDAAFHLIGEPLGEFASVFSENRVGAVRYLPDRRRLYSEGRADNTSRSPLTFRALTRDEIDVPLKLGAVNVVPFATGRLADWCHSPFDGNKGQAFGNIGARAGTQFWRLFEDVRSRLLDLYGIRHIIKPEFTGWVGGSNVDSFELYPFDRPLDESIEGVNGFSGASVAVRQRWQTKRGGPGQWRVVDWITLDVQAAFFGDVPDYQTPIGHMFTDRPESSVARNHVTADFSYRISDTTAILSDANWDLNKGEMAKFDLSYAVERTPRLAYFVGYRKITAEDSNLLGIGANYQLNTKHTVAVREYFDLERGETETFDVTIIRRFPRWYGALTLNLNNVEENVGMSVSVWPEGVPEAAIGSAKYTGLATSTGINAQQKE
jgi:hypothetical protein